jgi:hypothetical protein
MHMDLALLENVCVCVSQAHMKAAGACAWRHVAQCFRSLSMTAMLTCSKSVNPMMAYVLGWRGGWRQSVGGGGVAKTPYLSSREYLRLIMSRRDCEKGGNREVG